jgi:ribosomal protein L11 methyltransferase
VTDEEPWLIQVDVPQTDVDLVSGLLWDAGVTGVWEIPLDEGTRLTGGTDRRTAESLAAELVARWPSEAYTAEHDGWLDSWRPYAQPITAGRFHLYPAWSEAVPPPGTVAVPIDAGRAFGQGSHATTRLMLTEIDRVVDGGERVLDVGCGSGVLGVVAAVAGAASVVGVDIEQRAIDAALANAQRNGVADRTTFSTTPVAEVDGQFDLVVANILANILRELAEGITARLAPGGTLLLSGVLESQRDRLLDCYRPGGLELVNETEHDGWLCLTLKPVASERHTG